MAALDLINNCQLMFVCFLFLTVNTATSKEIKKKDSAIASEEIKPKEPELNNVITHINSKYPNPIQEITTKAKNASASNATKVNTNVEQHKELSYQPPVEGTIAPKERWNNIADETQFNLKEANYDYDNDELPQSFVTSFYIFLGLSVGAMLFILVKVYRLRLSRAERKYGVQGDRSTQELVPLPTSIEDVNSEDEDQTLFEVNRQQIRIL